jgi:hypothetical protein
MRSGYDNKLVVRANVRVDPYEQSQERTWRIAGKVVGWSLQGLHYAAFIASEIETESDRLRHNCRWRFGMFSRQKINSLRSRPANAWSGQNENRPTLPNLRRQPNRTKPTVA